MPHLKIMDTEPDKLFEQYSVSEVESVLLSINNEIERKKVELRTLVGERYRDLIETADTISEMKTLSEQFIKEVEVMNVDMGKLKLKQGLVAKADPVKKKRSVSFSVHDSIAAQLSILVDLPELIWSAISLKDYVRAAQLFLLGRHIKTGFSVDKNLAEFAERLPVLDQQWNALSHFPKTILNAAECDLKSLDITSEEACTCLCAMALLDSRELTDRLLSLRLETIENTLQNDGNVKHRIVDSYNAIVKSLSIVWDCLANENYAKELFWKRLPQVADAQSPPVIKLIEKGVRLKYLPPIIVQFRASSQYSAGLFEFRNVPPKISSWLDKVKTLATKKGTSLLKNIVSLHSLESLTNIQITNYREWDQLLISFKIVDKFDLWNEVYKPLISSRAKELISMHCDEAFNDIVQSLESSFAEDNPFQPDNDLRWFVWKESPDDLEIDPLTSTRGLLLKAKGIIPKITEICRKFEKNLITLYEDLSGLYSSDVTLQADSNELKLHQQNVYLKLLLRLKEHVRGFTQKDSMSEGQLSIVARFLLALPDLCPTLQKCLALSVDNKSTPWEDAKVLLETEGLFLWSCWERKAALRLEAIIPLHLSKPTSYAQLLNIIPEWEMVWIEEGEEHRSQLRVPAGPSFPLQAVLHGLSTELAKAHLPRLVSENLMQKLLPKLIGSYDTNSPLCQAESLQNLFDVKYLLAQFIPITNKELSSLCQEKISQIEANIDPFDLDVFSPYITANVKASVQRMQLLFGTYCIVRSDDAGHQGGPKMLEDPCTLALSKSSAWFPLIPVTNPVSKPLHLVKPKVSMQSLLVIKTQYSSIRFKKKLY